MTAGVSTRPVSKRYAKRHEEIIQAASRHINAYGVRGMTLTSVARDLAIDTSSLLYYFRNKEELAAACLRRTLEWQRSVALIACEESVLEDVVRSFIHSFIDLHRRDTLTPAMAVLSDMHSLAGESRLELFAAYGATIHILLLRLRKGGLSQERALVATAVILATSHWITAWINSYRDADFARVEERLMDLLVNGLGGNASAYEIHADFSDSEDAQSRFLLAATDLLNKDGYHGASVEKIAAELGVSTGSFYHHLDNKDELVVACFKKSHRLFEQAFEGKQSTKYAPINQLNKAIQVLVSRQVISNQPLLRTGTYHALPLELRRAMLALAQQDTLYVAGIISDAIAEGLIRCVDPMIAGHFFTTIVTAAGDIRRWEGTGERRSLCDKLADVLNSGILKQHD